jgi:hydrogenase expression/formation protein HypC
VCVSIPARVVSIEEGSGTSIPASVLVGDAELRVDLGLVPEADVGDYVVIHSGYAISIIPRARAEETIVMLGFDSPGQ